MIDLTNRHLYRLGQHNPIVQWAVWFMTPFGITPDVGEAVERCLKSDLDPEFNITPIPVAIDNGGDYEIFYPRR